MVTYLDGNAVEPVGEGHKIIAHICNDIGAWGKGFVLAITEKYGSNSKTIYKEAIKYDKIGLGDIQLIFLCEECVEIDSKSKKKSQGIKEVKDVIKYKIVLANMIAQHGIYKDEDGNPPIRYDSLKRCLGKLKKEAIKMNASIHMPRIGAGLAGGDWKIIEEIINDKLEGVDVFIYNFVEGGK